MEATTRDRFVTAGLVVGSLAAIAIASGAYVIALGLLDWSVRSCGETFDSGAVWRARAWALGYGLVWAAVPAGAGLVARRLGRSPVSGYVLAVIFVLIAVAAALAIASAEHCSF